jgi:predicted DNA-binding transcriptional regulator AlpA
MAKRKTTATSITEFVNDDGKTIRFEKLLTATMICELFSISRATLDRHIKSNQFMKPLLYIGNSPRWADLMVVDWLKENSATRKTI